MRYFITLLLLFLGAFCPAYASQWTTGGTAGGAGDVVGPASSVDNTIPRFDLVTGKILQGSLCSIDDNNNMTIPATKTSIHNFTSANWTFTGGHWTMGATGPLVHVTGNTSTATATLTEAVDNTTPLTYKITITGTGSGGTATWTFGGVTGTPIAASGAIAIVNYITPSTTDSMIITPSSACTVSITSITIEKQTDATGDLTVEGNLTVRSPATFNGQILTGAGTITSPSFSFVNDPKTGFYRGGSGILASSHDGVRFMWIGSTYISLLTDSAKIQFGSGQDTILTRLAANSLAMRNSTAAQQFSRYGTYTDASNYFYTYHLAADGADTWSCATAGTGADDCTLNITPVGTGAVKLGKTVLNNSAVTCVANVCTDVPASPSLDITTDATAGADVLTIADGITGEIRIINLKTDGGTDLEITPTNFANGTKITLGSAGQSAVIRFDGTKWHILVTYSGVVS